IDSAVFVSFRGTSQVRNWLSNLDVFMTPGPWGKVHRGFLRALDELYPRIVQTLAALARPTRVWVTRHSLGGALATLVCRQARGRKPGRRAGHRDFRPAGRRRSGVSR